MPTPPEGPKWTDKAIVFLTLGIVGAAVWQAVLVNKQWEEMADAGKQTNSIIAEAGRLADANETLAQGMTNSVAQAKASLAATLRQGQQSLAQSKRSLDTTVEMARNAQRAWVGAVEPSATITVGSPFSASMTIKNYGQTPALMVRNWVHLDRGPAGVPFKPRPYGGGDSQSCSVLQPGQEMKVPAIENVNLTQALADGIKNETISVYFSGEIKYEDIFGEHHEATFAYALMPSLLTWRVLDKYNTMK